MLGWAFARVVFCFTMCLMWPALARAQIALGFPSPDAQSSGFEYTGPLGAGGGILHHVAGDQLTETFLDTSVSGASSSRWVFSMSEFTKINFVSTFNAQINSVTVGSFSFAGSDGQAVQNFDLTFNHAPIAGDDYTLGIVATSTLLPGEGAWNWITGGVVSLNGTLGVGSPTVVDAGTFQINTGNIGTIVSGKPFQLGSAITGSSNVALLVNVATNSTFNNGIIVSADGTGSVTIGTNSALSATNAVTFSAPIVLNRPTTLQATNTGAGRTTYSSTISGNVGTLTIAGGGRTTWQGINTFVGDIVVKDAGTVLQVGGPLTAPGDRIPNSSSVELQAGTFLRLQNFGETINALSGSGTVDNIAGSNTLTVGATGGSGTFSGVLADGDPSRVLSLTKIGAGTQVLSGPNTYKGATNVAGGALRIEHALSLGAASAGTTVADGGRLELAGDTTVTGEALSLAGTGGGLGALYSQSGNNTWNGTITLESPNGSFGAAAGQTLVVKGIVQDGGGTTATIASGNAGIVKFEANNTYTGGTAIAGGTLSVQKLENLGAPSGTTLVDFIGSGTLQTTGSFTTTQEITAIGANRSITLDVAASQSLTIDSQIQSRDGAGVVTKTGAGALILNTSNPQLKSDIALAQGTLDIRHAGAIGDAAASDFVIASGGTTTRLAFDNSTTVSGSFQTAGSGANLLVDRVGAGVGVAHSLTNLVLDGAHTLNVTAGSQITSGTAGLNFSGVTTLNGNATISVDNSAAAATQLTLASITGAGQNLTIGGTGNTTVVGSIATATGSLTKQGSGTLTLQGASTYSGATNVQQGVLHLAGGSLAAGSLTTVASGGLLLVDGGAFGGVITGAGDVRKATTATLAFGGMNSYGGTTFVDAGTLMVNNLTSGQGDFIVASGARLGGKGTIGLATGYSVKVSPFPGELSPGAADLPYTPPVIGSYFGHPLDATYSAGQDQRTVDKLTIDGDVILGGYLLIDLLSPTKHDVLEVSGLFSIGADAQLEINGETTLGDLDFLGLLGMSEGVPLTLVLAGSVSGNFANVRVNEPFVDAGGHTIVLRSDNGHLYLLSPIESLAVPEAHGAAMWIMACGAFVFWRRRTHRRWPTLPSAAHRASRTL